MKKIPKHNRHALAVLEFIRAHPLCTTAEIEEGTGFRRRSVYYSVNRLIEAELIHVPSYSRDGDTNHPTRQFRSGPGANRPKPKVSKRHILERQNAWVRRRDARQRVIKQAQSMGVFGVVAAQVMR